MTNKKTYMSPAMKAHSQQTTNMIAASFAEVHAFWNDGQTGWHSTLDE